MLGLALGDYIEMLLGNAVVVAWALIIGGIAILVVEKLARPGEIGGVAECLAQAIGDGIGLVQCLAMIPGVSRSGATILGAMSSGSTARPRPSSASSSPCRRWPARPRSNCSSTGPRSPPASWPGSALGGLVSFVVAVIVVKAFISIITRFGFAPFAWYRIVAGAAALVWLGMR